jgi:hypothetical protein
LVGFKIPLFVTLYLESRGVPETRGSQEPVIAHMVFNFISKANRKVVFEFEARRATIGGIQISEGL